MEFKSLQELVRIVENALAIQFYGQSTVLRKTVLKVLAHVLGGALYMVILIAKRIWKNRFISTCDVSALEGFGTEYGIPRKVPMAASGNVLFTLEDGVGSVEVSQGTVLAEPNTGLEYEVAATVIVTPERGGVPVRCSENGADGNLAEGTVLEFRDEPIVGVDQLTSVDVGGGVADPVEIDGDIQVWGELAEEYRARLLNRVQNPPHGGSLNDYWQWAMRFAFVTGAYVFPNAPETNSVSVAVANYNRDSLVLTPDQLSEVESYITDDVRRPITADVRVFNVTPVDVTITASIAPYNESVRKSVSDAIVRYLKSVGPGNTISAEMITLNVLSNSTAETFAVTSMTKDGATVQSIVLALSFPENAAPVAEVAKIGLGSINLINGES